MNKRFKSYQTTIRFSVAVLTILLIQIMVVSASIPKIIFNFDDPNWQDSVNLINQTLSANNQRGVLFVVTSVYSDSGQISVTPSLLQSYHQLYNNGWDISSHTVTHSDLTTLNDQQLQSELNNSYDWLVSNGFSRSSGYLAYPYGSFDTRVVDATKKRYVIARSVIYGLQDTITAGDYAIKIIRVDNITSPQEVMGEIDTAISQNKILVLLFHTIVIDKPAPSTYTYSQSNLQEISDYIKSKGNAIDVVTFSDLLTDTPDIISPEVIGTTPTGPNVPVNSKITVAFNETMNQTSAQSAFSTSSATTGNFSWNGNNMSYAPGSNLTNNTTYTATVGTGARDLAGNNLQSPYSWQFTTASAPDKSPPTVIGNTPTGPNVPLNSKITVTFNETMNRTSAQSAFSTSPATTGNFSWSGNNISYTPSSNLTNNTTYTATVGTGARDLAGNRLKSPYSWQFTTASVPDKSPPTVIGNTPTGSNVPVNSKITVTFNESMNQTSAQSAFSTSPATTGSFNWNRNNMSYTPSSNLTYSTTYTATVGIGAMDLAGKNLQSPYSWPFITESKSTSVIKIDNGFEPVNGTNSLNITALNITDLSNFDITLSYDPSIVKVTNANNNPVFGISLNNLEQTSSGIVKLITLNTGSGQSGDVLLSTLTFKAVGVSGQVSHLNLTVNTFINSAEAEIPAGVRNGTFTVGLPKTGDINGDGKLTLVDAIYLAKHVGGFIGYETIYADGDINANGKVTLVDAIYLAKHVGGFIGYEKIY